MKRALLMGLFALASACRKSPPTTTAPTTDGGPAGVRAADATSIARAEDQRRAGDVGERALTSHDVLLRRLAARALARIADDASESGLFHALSDEDPEVAAWGAYGLGFTCKGKEEAHVAALAARAASLDESKLGNSAAASGIDLRVSIARAVGKCGGLSAEPLLAAWVRARDAWSEGATYGLGDIANKRGVLNDETQTALLDAAAPSASGPLPTSLYPFSRAPHVSEAFAQRVLEAARDQIGTASPLRIFAVRALARVGPAAAGDLSRVASAETFLPAERAEAARGLGQLGLPGKQGASDALVKIVESFGDAVASKCLGDTFVIVDTLVNDLGSDPPTASIPILQKLSALQRPDSTRATALRTATLRCDAAAALVNKGYDAIEITQCDAPGSFARDHATLKVLLRRPVVAERRKVWLAFAKGGSVRVREEALEAIADHPEIGDAARDALGAALTSKKAGIVTTAADTIKGHSDRVLVVSSKARAASLDPHSPPPTVGSAPARELDPEIARALSDALGQAWSEDLVETRTTLLEAAVAVDLQGAREAAAAACRDPNVTVRDAGKKALAALGQPYAACAAPDPPPPAASEVDLPPPHPTRLTFASDIGPLVIHLDPALAPISTARFAALAQSGFFHGILVHRVVPGFVAQFGDPQGDGFGGSGKLLRCETSPTAFNPGDVGIALAGRDTGSSQLFVTLSRTPHLDGQYTRVGHADGDWGALVDGDAIGDVKVEAE